MAHESTGKQGAARLHGDGQVKEQAQGGTPPQASGGVKS